jgi:DNA/RNA endonuclease YhcR with UshA esterase domain
MNGKLPEVTEKHLLVACVVIVLIGTVFIWLAYTSETTLTKIGDISEDMSFSHIKVRGKVSDFPSYSTDKYEQRTTIKFPINDGTGTMNVKLSDVVSDALLKAGTIPAYGQEVELEGKVSVSEYSKTLTVINPAYVKILTKEDDYVLTNISLVPAVASEGKLIKVSGTVKSLSYLGFAYSFNVTDGYGEVNVFFQTTFANINAKNPYELKGANVTVKGALKWYAQKSYWEIMPTTWNDIEILSTPVERYALRSIGELLGAPGTYLNTSCRIENVSIAFIGTSNLTVTDGTNYLNIYSTVSITSWGNFKVGDKLLIQGKFTKYGDAYEIKVESSNPSHYILEVYT